jgi:hypothetical protein
VKQWLDIRLAPQAQAVTEGYGHLVGLEKVLGCAGKKRYSGLTPIVHQFKELLDLTDVVAMIVACFLEHAAYLKLNSFHGVLRRISIEVEADHFVVAGFKCQKVFQIFLSEHRVLL